VKELPFGDAVEGLDAIFWEMDARSRRFTSVTGRAEAILGYPVDQWLAEAAFWERIVHVQDRARSLEVCREAVLDRRDHLLEYRAIAADGRIVWLRDHVTVVTNDDNEVTKLRGVMVDVTERRRAEASALRAEQGERRMTDRMRGVAGAAAAVIGAHTLPELLEALRVAADGVFSSDLLSLALYDETADTLELLPYLEEGLTGESIVVPVAGSPVERVVREGKPLFARNSDEPGAARLVATGGRTPQAGMRIPMRKGQRVLGVLSIHSYTPDRFDRADLSAAEMLAGLAAAAVVNIRFIEESRAAEAALRRGERFLTLLQQVTAAANESASFEEAASRCMAALCRHTGWPTAHVFVRTPEGDLISTGLWERNDPGGERELTSLATQIRYQYGMGLVGRVMAAEMPVWIEDVTRDAGFIRAGVTVEVRGAFAFPVLVGGRVDAVIEFFSREPVAPDDTLLDAAVQIGVQLGRVLERERTQEHIRFQARLLDSVGQAVIASDIGHRIVYWNRAAEALYGWTRDEALGRIDSDVVTARADAGQTAEIMARLAAGQAWAGEFTVRRKDGVTLPVHITGSAIYDASGTPAGYVGVATDLSRSKELEAQLRRAQKLEAVGQLAGGVAHDFNNMLTSIKGTTHLLLDDLAEDHPLRFDIEEIQRSADRAATLTSELLAFSRRQVLQPRVLAINDELTRMRPMLERIAGEGVRLELELAPDLGHARLDGQQFGHVLANLVGNARDALSGQGTITIRTDNVELTRDDVRRYPYEVRPGAYVMLCVEDEGPPIEPDEIDRVFDPFFTTRRRGRPPGLGLSTVYGIVKQSGGYVWVDSRAEALTTFRAIFPRVDALPDVPSEPYLSRARRGSETVLLVEDEPTVRRLVHRVLTRQGYTVLEAANGVEALRVCEEHSGGIDLVVTDVVMPEMGGGELAERLKIVLPRTPVLMISGYAEDAVLRHGIAEAQSWFLEKPFTPDSLVRKVREVLDAESGTLAGQNPNHAP
jgi:PAS domain S-box-containing protein